jgi:hypothetical protein
MFSDSFHKAASPLQDDSIRSQLQDAILRGDTEQFRRILEGVSPELANETRIYGVVTLTADGMHPIMVDNSGKPLPSDYVIARNTPIDMLNVTYTTDTMIVTIGNDVYEAPIGRMHDANTDSQP